MIKFLKKINIKNLDILLFFAFIFSIPFEKRHIFNLSDATLGGQFFEWKAFSLYLSDILFILVLAFWLLKYLSTQYKKVKTGESSKYQKINIKLVIILLSLFLIIALVSILSSNYTDISLYKYLKLIEGFLLFIYIVKNISSIPLLITSVAVFIFSGFIQSVIAIIQFIWQKSLGLKILGEVDLAPGILNVAKINLDGEKYIRAYGTLPHANILGGFLFISLLFCVCLIVLFALNKEKEENVPRGTFYQKKFETVIILVFCVIFIGLIVSFSRSAYMALIFSIIIGLLLIIKKCKGRLRHILSKLKSLSINQKYLYYIALIFIILSLIMLSPFLLQRYSDTQEASDFSIQGRVFYIEKALEMIGDRPEFGVGIGTYPLELKNYVDSTYTLQWWEKKPVHNVLLLIGAEMGIAGLLLFSALIVWIIYKSCIVLKRKNNTQFVIIFTSLLSFVGIVLIMQFDHYFWTIQQGILTFWFIVGILITSTTRLGFRD